MFNVKKHKRSSYPWFAESLVASIYSGESSHNRELKSRLPDVQDVTISLVTILRWCRKSYSSTIVKASKSPLSSSNDTWRECVWLWSLSISFIFITLKLDSRRKPMRTGHPAYALCWKSFLTSRFTSCPLNMCRQVPPVSPASAFQLSLWSLHFKVTFLSSWKVLQIQNLHGLKF